MPIRDPQAAREHMIEKHIAARGIRTPSVLAAMRQVPRERFLPPNLQDSAYEDRALPVGHDQTISQPYIVALMTEMLRVEPHHRILEIGTGTGYQTAILAHLARDIWTIERIASLSQEAAQRLLELGLSEHVRFRVGDGTLGWEEHAPFDRILVTAAAPAAAGPLVSQLAEGGRLIAPIGQEGDQYITAFSCHHGKIKEERSIAVRFVRLIGEAGFPE